MKSYLALLLCIALPSMAHGENRSVDRTSRQFVSAVNKGSDLVEAGIVPALTPLQSEQLKALKRCTANKSDRSSSTRILIIWTCSHGSSMEAYLTELTFEGAAIANLAIEQLEARPQWER